MASLWSTAYMLLVSLRPHLHLPHSHPMFAVAASRLLTPQTLPHLSFCIAFLPSPSRPCSSDSLILLQTSVGSACIQTTPPALVEGIRTQASIPDLPLAFYVFPLRYYPFSFDVARPFLGKSSYSLSWGRGARRKTRTNTVRQRSDGHTPLSTFPLGRRLSIIIAAFIRTPMPIPSARTFDRSQ